MKAHFLVILALLSVAGLLSCKKGDDARPSENTITQFLASESTVTSGVRTSGPWELGVVFSTSVAGKITQVGSKMPEPGSYRVIIWDFDTKAALRQKTVEQTSADKLTLEALDALDLTPNKKYVISINSQSSGTNKKYAFASKTGGTEFMPFTKGSILVYNTCYSGVATATFPNSTQNIKYELYGYPEFTFVAE
jgi:hypothetical protein